MSVLVARLDKKEGIIAGHSECPGCLTGLKWYDLVPLFSFIAVRGKCRYCKNPISKIYPAMEISVAGSFFLYFWIKGFSAISPFAFYDLAIIFILLILTFFDYLYYILPDKIIFSGIGLAVIYKFLFFRADLLSSLYTGLGLASFFAIIFLVSKGEWMGFGDVKLALFIGLILGFPFGMLSIIGSVWAGAIWGLAMMAIKRGNLKTALPFGSFICVMAILFIIFNDFNFLLPKIF